jgi:hypothetical protein
VSVVAQTTRVLLEVRAGHRCEYCLLPMRGQVATFPIDHIIPRIEDGSSDLENLAVTCGHCNGRKWKHTCSLDPVTGDNVALFHPRRDRWKDHFQWSAGDPAVLEGISPTGRATVNRLEMNHPKVIDTRRVLLALGLFANS